MSRSRRSSISDHGGLTFFWYVDIGGDLSREICAFLSPTDFVSLSRTTKARDEAFNDVRLWKKIVANYWPEISYALCDLPDTDERPLVHKSRWIWDMRSSNHVQFFLRLEQQLWEFLRERHGMNPGQRPGLEFLQPVVLRREATHIFEGEVVMRLLKDSHSEDLLALACYVVKRLTGQHQNADEDFYENALAKQNIVTFMNAIIAKHPTHKTLARDALGATGNVTFSADNLELFMTQGGLEHVFKLMDLHDDDADVLQSAYFITGSLARSKHVGALKEDFVKKACAHMKKHMSHKDLVDDAALSLRGMFKEDLAKTIAALPDDFCTTLLEAMRYHKKLGSSEAHELIYHLLRSPPHQKTLLALGLVDALVESLQMDTSRRRKFLAMANLYAISQLNLDETSTFAAWRDRLCQPAFTIAKVWKNDPQIMRAFMHIYGFYCVKPANVKPLLELGFNDFLVKEVMRDELLAKSTANIGFESHFAWVMMRSAEVHLAPLIRQNRDALSFLKKVADRNRSRASLWPADLARLTAVFRSVDVEEMAH